MLANTVRRASFLVMRRAIHSCIIPILIYGALVWWPGVTQHNQKKNIVQNRVQELCDKLKKIQNKALKVILPAWKTTLIKIIEIEAATKYVRQTIDYLCELASLHLHTLEPRHLLHLKAKETFSLVNPTQLERLARRCPENVESSNPLLEPVLLEKHILGGTNRALIVSRALGDKEKAVTSFHI